MAMPLTCGNIAGVPFRILTPSVRDEEAAGSKPATPTINLHVTASFRNQFRLLARVGFRMRERAEAEPVQATALTRGNALPAGTLSRGPDAWERPAVHGASEGMATVLAAGAGRQCAEPGQGASDLLHRDARSGACSFRRRHAGPGSERAIVMASRPLTAALAAVMNAANRAGTAPRSRRRGAARRRPP